MELSGTFELEDTTVDEVWLALSDPAMVQHALPGCQFLVRVEGEDVDFEELREQHDEPPELTADPAVIEERAFEAGTTYAALVEISVGSVSPGFETVVTVDEREKPRMAASGEGSAGNSSFEMRSGMELEATEDGVAVRWDAAADVFGRIARMGQRVVDPVANRVVKRFFRSMQDQLRDLDLEPEAEATEEAEEVEAAAAAPGAAEAEADSEDRATRIKRLLDMDG